MTKASVCIKCGKPIAKKDELIVTNRLFIRFATFHKDCFQKAFKKGEYVGRPVNTPTANISLGLILLTALILFLMTRDYLVLAVLVVSPLYRLLVWYRFERQIGN